MASLRDADVTPVEGGQSIVKIATLATVVTGDTYTVPVGTSAAFAINTTTSDALYSALSSGVLTITVANTPSVLIVCIL